MGLSAAARFRAVGFLNSKLGCSTTGAAEIAGRDCIYVSESGALQARNDLPGPDGVAEAQRLILGDLETQFGRSAVAAWQTLGGAHLFLIARPRRVHLRSAARSPAKALTWISGQAA